MISSHLLLATISVNSTEPCWIDGSGTCLLRPVLQSIHENQICPEYFIHLFVRLHEDVECNAKAILEVPNQANLGNGDPQDELISRPIEPFEDPFQFSVILVAGL